MMDVKYLKITILILPLNIKYSFQGHYDKVVIHKIFLNNFSFKYSCKQEGRMIQNSCFKIKTSQMRKECGDQFRGFQVLIQVFSVNPSPFLASKKNCTAWYYLVNPRAEAYASGAARKDWIVSKRKSSSLGITAPVIQI